MDLSNGIAKKEKYAQYIIDEITHVCTKFEKRGPGSYGEQQSCEYAAEQMKELGCDRVFVEGFKENPGSFFGWIYFTITFCFLALASYLLKVPALSIVFIAIGLLICVLQFGLYKKLVDKFFKEKTGHNATGFKKPTGEVKRRIIFNGHPDAAWEWPFKYKFKYLGFDIHMIVCFIGAFYTLGIAIARVAGINDALALKLGLGALVFVPFWFGLYFMWNPKKIVDGANDNLTGCYMGMAILQMLKDEGIEFENTEVGVIFSGSEEAGLRGAKAWCEAHKDEFNDVPTFIYSYDTIAQSEHLSVNYRDLNGTVKVDKDVSDLFYEACVELDIPCGKGMVPPLGGATDSAAFAQAGMRSTGITALNHALPDFYHTRLDTPEALNKNCLADCFAASVKVLEMFDNGAKQ